MSDGPSVTFTDAGRICNLNPRTVALLSQDWGLERVGTMGRRRLTAAGFAELCRRIERANRVEPEPVPSK
jgi:hypothetical protein